jgi:acyl-CoA thioester hydrolase
MARYAYEFRLRWSDIDVFRHVNNVAIVRFFEDARVALHLELGVGAYDTGAWALVARQEVDYKREIAPRTQPLVVDVGVEAIGRTSYTLSYLLREPGTDVVFAVGRTVQVCVDTATGRPRPVEEDLRRALSRFLDDGAEVAS